MTLSSDQLFWSDRTLVGREPESQDVSNEVARHQGWSSLPMDVPGNEVEYKASAIQLTQCLTKIKAAWSQLGSAQPHFSVLTNRQFLPESLAMNVDEFWASGELEAAQVERMALRYGFTNLSAKSCLEYGCGIGRVTAGLARRFGRVYAYDISAAYLQQAELRAQALAATNIKFNLCADNFLDDLTRCDLFYSRTVFQKTPPPIIDHLVRRALRSLNPNGIAIFQIPTYQVGYSFKIDQWLAADHALEMQMHCLPQEIILAAIAEERGILLSLREDDSAGAPERFISNVFVVQKRA